MTKRTSTDLVTPGASGSLTISTVDDLSRLSRMLAESRYFTDAREAAQAGVKVLAGIEMGFGMFASMTGIHIIEGKPSVGANLLAQAVKRSGKYDYRIAEHTDQVCRINFYEDGELLGESSFSIDDAKRAQVAFKTQKGYPTSWGKYPKAMLFARALSQGVRWHCPDVLGGTTAYVPEELGANVDEDGMIIDVAVSSPRSEAWREPIAEDDAITAEQLTSEPQPEEHEERSDPPEPTLTARQLTAIHTKFSILGFNGSDGDRERALAFLTFLTGRTIETSKELTKREASDILDIDDDALALKLDDFNTEQKLDEIFGSEATEGKEA